MAEKRMTRVTDDKLPTMEQHADAEHPVPAQKSYLGRLIDAAAGLASGGPTNKIMQGLGDNNASSPDKPKPRK